VRVYLMPVPLAVSLELPLLALATDSESLALVPRIPGGARSCSLCWTSSAGGTRGTSALGSCEDDTLGRLNVTLPRLRGPPVPPADSWPTLLLRGSCLSLSPRRTTDGRGRDGGLRDGSIEATTQSPPT
jgi:hypothetical protein